MPVSPGDERRRLCWCPPGRGFSAERCWLTEISFLGEGASVDSLNCPLLLVLGSVPAEPGWVLPLPETLGLGFACLAQAAPPG